MSWCAAPRNSPIRSTTARSSVGGPRPRRGAREAGEGGRGGRRPNERARPNTVGGGGQAGSDMQPPGFSAGGLAHALASVAPVDQGRGMAPCAKREYSASTVGARRRLGAATGDSLLALSWARRPRRRCARVWHTGPAPWRARARWVGGRPPRGVSARGGGAESRACSPVSGHRLRLLPPQGLRWGW